MSSFADKMSTCSYSKQCRNSIYSFHMYSKLSFYLCICLAIIFLSLLDCLSVYQPLVSSFCPFFVCLNRNIILVSHYTIYRKVTLLAAKRVGRPLGNGESSGRKFYKILFVVPRMTWVPWYSKKKNQYLLYKVSRHDISLFNSMGSFAVCIVWRLFGHCGVLLMPTQLPCYLGYFGVQR